MACKDCNKKDETIQHLKNRCDNLVSAHKIKDKIVKTFENKRNSMHQKLGKFRAERDKISELKDEFYKRGYEAGLKAKIEVD